MDRLIFLCCNTYYCIGETPSDSGSPSESAYMTLDEVTLSNLEVLVNNHDRSEKGSLWAFVNRCRTAFGRQVLCYIQYMLCDATMLCHHFSLCFKIRIRVCYRRLLRSWLCRPLFRAKDIRQRAAAVEELVELLPEEAQKAREILKGNFSEYFELVYVYVYVSIYPLPLLTSTFIYPHFPVRYIQYTWINLPAHCLSRHTGLGATSIPGPLIGVEEESS